MTRGTRTFIVVAIALVTASIASFTVYQTVQRLPGRTISVRQVPVVAATRTLSAGTRLTAAHLKVIQWPADAPIQGAHAEISDVIDRGLVAPVLANEPVTDSKLVASGLGAGLSPTIPPGMRAISVRVNEVIGVGLFVGPGTRVDVLATFATDDGPISRAVVDNVEIIASGTPYDAPPAGNQEERENPPTVVTLAVTPEQAERIALVATNGEILLALRNPMDVVNVQTPGVRLSGLLLEPPPRPAPPPAQAPVRRAAPIQVAVAAPPPAPLPPPPPKPYTVETIRAAKRTEERVREDADPAAEVAR